jgi:NitT/TauT family transport system substrate-binding protein
MQRLHTLWIGILLTAMASSAVAESAPVFSLAWSEYPSWSAFGVAHEYRIIDGRRGKMGPVETKWGVDIELKEADYDTCIVMYGAGQCDAACLTNIDSLAPALARPSVAILPTSTSDGADACIVTGSIGDFAALKRQKAYGLAKTVSEYCFVRNLELKGEDPSGYTFTNMDPGAAALAMQQKQKGFDAIVVWNPFVLETLNKRDDVRVLFDSSTIPGEIVDMVTMARDSLKRPGGENFACAVADAFYELNKKLADPATADDALVALGEKFSHLDLESMKTVVKQTRFYSTPEQGMALFQGQELQDTMKKVVAFCVDKEIVENAPVLSYGDGEGSAALAFDSRFMQRAAAGK